ncbi:MAG TPA: ATP-binding protein [Actinomycetota bacterium]|nr:ATP-binding protein [Actinomycetota bacterium]
MAHNLFPVVPDTGTLKAARLATEITGNPGRWVRLDCQHLRHVQQPVEAGQELECPTCPPSVGGGLPTHQVLGRSSERRRRAWLDAGPQAPGKAGAFAAEAVTYAGPISLVDDAGRMASELVASALRHTDAPVELTVDAGGDMVRIEVRDDDWTAPGTGKVVSFELREAPASA